jgi:hypothetical protein
MSSLLACGRSLLVVGRSLLVANYQRRTTNDQRLTNNSSSVKSVADLSGLITAVVGRGDYSLNGAISNWIFGNGH